MYIEIPTFSTITNSWSITNFLNKSDFTEFVENQYKEPGKYGLHNTNLWRQTAQIFEDTGKYTKLTIRSREWIKFWDFEKEKCLKGVIIDEFYIPEDYYFYLNFCVIPDMIKGKDDFPEIWDSDYHYFLHLKLCELYGLFDVVVKKRRWGLSLKNVARVQRLWLFKAKSIAKIIGYNDDNVSATWDMLKNNINFTNEHTAWYRNTVGQGYEIENKREVKVGNRKLYKGKLSKVKGVVTKQSPSRGVGGKGDLIFIEEAGVNPTVDKTFAYLVPTIKIGGVITGNLTIAGSVGELKEAEAIQKLFMNPKIYGFKSVTSEWPGCNEITTGFFVPTYWNYADVDLDEEGKAIGEPIRFYDKDGNSDCEGALKYIYKRRIVAKQKSHSDYQREISQNPINPKEPFDAKEENIFPVYLLNPQLTRAEELRNAFYPVELFYDQLGKVRYRLTNNTKVTDFPIKRDTKRDGCVIIYEFPISNAPVNLYFAGIDPVSSKQTAIENSKSLMSCYIMKGVHNIDGEMSQKQIVAEYTGRYEDPERTFEVVTMLWEFYNARPLIENNKEAYIQWLISKKKQHRLIKANEISNLREINFNYSSQYPYGVNVDKSNKTKDYLLDLIIDYVKDDKVKLFDDETGETTTIKCVNDIYDPELLKEMINYTPKMNVDRCFLPNTKITLKSGFTEIKDVKINDLVLTHTGSYEKVYDTLKNYYNGDIYGFKPNGSNEYTWSTPDHPHYIGSFIKKPCGELWEKRKWDDNNFKREWKKSKDIKTTDYFCMPHRKGLVDNGIDDDLLYFLGWFLSDGYLVKRNFRICFQIDQLHIAEHLKEIIEKYDDFSPRYYQGYNHLAKKEVTYKANRVKPKIYKVPDVNAYNLEFSSEFFQKFVEDNVITITIPGGKKGTSGEKILKEKIFNSNNTLSLIVGFLEGDGHQKSIYKNNTIKHHIEVSGTYHTLLNQMYQFLLDNNIYATRGFTKLNPNKPNTNIQYRIDIQDHEGINKIAEKSLKFNKVVSKKQTKHHLIKSDGIWIPVKNINIKQYKGFVYNLEVEKDHSYVSNNLATHNCFAFGMCLWAVKIFNEMNHITVTKKEKPNVPMLPRRKQGLFLNNKFGMFNKINR